MSRQQYISVWSVQARILPRYAYQLPDFGSPPTDWQTVVDHPCSNQFICHGIVLFNIEKYHWLLEVGTFDCSQINRNLIVPVQ